jgi:hypothetical protein
MAKNTFPVSGGAMPKIDRAAIMRRAWAIFRGDLQVSADQVLGHRP